MLVHSDEELLWILMGLLYAMECFRWRGTRSVWFVPSQTRGYSVARPARDSTTPSFILAGWRPADQTFSGLMFPVMVDEDGLLIEESSGPAKFLAFEELGSLHIRGSVLELSENDTLDLDSPAQADCVAMKIIRCRMLPREQRRAEITRMLTKSYDVRECEQVLQRLRDQTRSLGVVCTVWAFWTACIGFSRGSWQMESGWMLAAAGFVVGWIAVGWLLVLANRSLKSLRGQHWQHRLCQLFLTPTSAMRAPSWFTNSIAMEFEPATLAAVLCSHASFENFVLERLRELNFPLQQEKPAMDDVSGWKVFSFYQAERKRILEELMQSKGIAIPADNHPDSMDWDAFSYCPRCLGQYRQQTGTCPDCPGVQLRAIQIARSM